MVFTTPMINTFLVMTVLAGAFIIFVLLPRNRMFAGFATFLLGFIISSAEGAMPGVDILIIGSSWIIMLTGIWLTLYGWLGGK